MKNLFQKPIVTGSWQYNARLCDKIVNGTKEKEAKTRYFVVLVFLVLAVICLKFGA